MPKATQGDGPRGVHHFNFPIGSFDEKRMSVSIVVYGTPVPQGSKRAFFRPGMRHAVIIEDNKRTKPWRQEIAGAAVEAMRGRAVLLEPVTVHCIFYFDRPKSLKKSVFHKTTKPDVDKLSRTVLDALTGTAFKDDSQVVTLSAIKLFGERPRAEIHVTVLTGEVELAAKKGRRAT